MRTSRPLVLAGTVLALALVGTAAAVPGPASATTVEVAAAAEVRAPVIREINQMSIRITSWTNKPAGSVRWDSAADARITGFSVLVNGEVQVTTGPSVRATHGVTWAVGRNELVVRAHTADGVVDSVVRVVILDVEAPHFTFGPRIEVREGPVATSSAPLQLRWAATDDHELVSGHLRQGGSYLTFFNGHWVDLDPLPFSHAPGTTTWDVDLKDRARNVGRVTLERGVEVRGESLGTYTSSWTRATSSLYTHGTAMRATRNGASMTFTTTARSIGWVGYTKDTAGTVRVYVDGKDAGLVDLSHSRSGPRVVWLSLIHI